MKKKGIMVLIICIFLIGLGVGLFFLLRGGKAAKGNGKLVYVEKVGNLQGGYLGQDSRFMGIVESQESKNVEKDPDKKVKDILVKVGDTVNEGDPLFTYDTEQAELDIESKELELESLKNGIQSDYEQVAELKKLRNGTSGSEKLSYTSQINSLLAKIHEDEYNLSLKEAELQRAKEGVGETVVTAPMAGVIKNIQNTDGGDQNPYGNGDYYGGYDSSGGDNTGSAFMTIMAIGDYRVKGTVTETNIHQLQQGMAVILRSRLHQDQIWRGTISRVDLEPVQNDNGGMYYDMGRGESASRYNFYVDPENSEGLILGQHLYIEMDYGQGEVKDGLYIPSYYLMEENGTYYIWKKASDDTITRAGLQVGEYDEMTDSYRISDGLTVEDYIAFPEDRIQEGNPTTTNYEEVAAQLASEQQEQTEVDIHVDLPGTDDGKDMSFDIPEKQDPMVIDGPVVDEYTDPESIVYPEGQPEEGMIVYDGADVGGTDDESAKIQNEAGGE